MSIKFIIDTVTSERDTHGNCYHFAIITSTKTGKSLSVNVGGDMNAVSTLKRLTGLGWSRVHYTDSCISKRAWGQCNQGVKMQEHELTLLMLNSLCRKNGKVY